MIAELSRARVTLATDKSHLALAQQSINNAADAVKIVKRQMEAETVALTDVSPAMGIYQQARASVANYRMLVIKCAESTLRPDSRR